MPSILWTLWHRDKWILLYFKVLVGMQDKIFPLDLSDLDGLLAFSGLSFLLAMWHQEPPSPTNGGHVWNREWMLGECLKKATRSGLPIRISLWQSRIGRRSSPIYSGTELSASCRSNGWKWQLLQVTRGSHPQRSSFTDSVQITPSSTASEGNLRHAHLLR